MDEYQSFWRLEDVPVIRVPHEVNSITEAVKQLDTHGRILVSGGSYKENITIKPRTKIIIQAETSEHPKLIASNPEYPVILVAPKGKLGLKGFLVHGERASLVAGSQSKGAADTILIWDTQVSGSVYGIYGYARHFHMERSNIENNTYGIALAGSTTLLNTRFHSNVHNLMLTSGNTLSCSEAFSSPKGDIAYIENATIMYSENTGIAICNMKSATIKQVYLNKNNSTGIQIRNTEHYSLTNSRIYETLKKVGDFGDGLEAINSDGDISNNWFSANQRCNILLYNSGGTIENNTIIYSTFGIALEDGADPNVINNFMYGNQRDYSLGSSSGRLPLAPFPDIPSL